MIASIVLAAGTSRRLGKPKQLVVIGGETLLGRAVRTAREAGCAPVVVVLGANCAEILEHGRIPHTVTVTNLEWMEGMASSIRLGIETLSPVAGDAEGVVVLACDQPAVTASHLRALSAGGELTASAYAGRSGVPAYFPRTAFASLLQLHGDKGARELLQDAHTIELSGGEIDVDTPEDLDLAEKLFGSGRA